MTRNEAFALVVAERERQAAKWNQAHAWGWGDCSSSHVPQSIKAAVLTEECGEVARALLDEDKAALRAELVQVAAVAIAWLEGME